MQACPVPVLSHVKSSCLTSRLSKTPAVTKCPVPPMPFSCACSHAANKKVIKVAGSTSEAGKKPVGEAPNGHKVCRACHRKCMGNVCARHAMKDVCLKQQGESAAHAMPAQPRAWARLSCFYGSNTTKVKRHGRRRERGAGTRRRSGSRVCMGWHACRRRQKKCCSGGVCVGEGGVGNWGREGQTNLITVSTLSTSRLPAQKCSSRRNRRRSVMSNP